jgi:hypothetical protein
VDHADELCWETTSEGRSVFDSLCPRAQGDPHSSGTGWREMWVAGRSSAVLTQTLSGPQAVERDEPWIGRRHLPP